MSGFTEAVLVVLVIAVIGLAIRNSNLEREKELLLMQLRRMGDKEQGKSPELPATTKTAEVPKIETGHCYYAVACSANNRWTFTIQNTSCEDCGSVRFEMRTYGGLWEYADTHCANCGKLIRRFDAA